MGFLLMVNVSNLNDLGSLSGFSNEGSVCPKRGVCVVYSGAHRVHKVHKVHKVRPL